MLDIETIRELLADRNLRAVARGVGIHSNTLYRIVCGTRKPRYETLKKLSDYLSNTARND